MRAHPVLAAVAVTVLGLAGCGGDDDDEGSATRIEATAAEYRFDPDSWTVQAGEEFTIEFTNDGTLEHEWAVIKKGDDLESEKDFEEDKVLFEVEAVPAGETTTETFTVEDSGDYQVICAIAGHFGQGMEGSLTVE